MAPESPRLVTIFNQLPGTWNLHRELQSTNEAEPSGKCNGLATFSARDPSVFVDHDGKVQIADAELIYHEQGEFELYQSRPGSGEAPRFPFSRKYIWRLQRQVAETQPVLSVWFTKPGTETIDYLFHKVDIQSHGGEVKTTPSACSCVEGSGCHLCEEEFYSSSYTFQLVESDSDQHNSGKDTYHLQKWQMVHEVRGPNKDQHIETHFSRD